MRKEIGNYYILLSLDDVTKQNVHGLKLNQKAFRIPYTGFYPHLTVAHFPEGEKKKIVRTIKRISKQFNAFNIELASVAVLNKSLVALLLSDFSELRTINEKIHQYLDFTPDEWTDPNSGKFLPHVSLYYNETENLERIKKHFESKFKAIKGKVVAIELSIFDGRNFTISHRFLLKKRLF